MVTRVALQRLTLIPAAIGLAALLVLTAETFDPQAELLRQTTEQLHGPQVEYAQVSKIVSARCLSCHSTHATDDWYPTAPKGIFFETEAQLRARADRIFLQVVAAKSMPLANKTRMTDDERKVVGLWLKQQGLLQKP